MTNETVSKPIEKVDLANKDEVIAGSAYLRDVLGYSMMNCRKALHVCNGDVRQAAEHLASGAWMTGLLISWDWKSLSKSCEQLSKELGLPETMCLPILKNCAGNVELAKRKLMCLPALP